MSYKAYGRVRRTDNGQGIPNLRVKAYDVDWISSDDYLGQAITSSNGDFNIQFNESAFDAGWFDPEGGPDIIIKVYDSSGNFLHQTSERSGAGKQTYFDIRIDPLDLLGEYTVQGIVRDARTSRALCNLKVEAWDDDFIFDDKLGSTVQTDLSGKYLVPFNKSDFSGLFEGNPDVYVKVKNDAGTQLARSQTVEGAPKHSTVNVNVGGQEISRSVSECVYGWTAAYRQEGTHIIVRIELNPDTNVTAQEIQNLRTTWEQTIESKWGNRFACCCSKTATHTLRCRNWGALTFDVQWVNSNPHHTVRVRRGPERSNMTTWDTSDTGDVASHEFGHMLGLVDEYSDPVCPNRSPVNTGTIMDDNTEVVERQVEHLCKLLNENAVPIIELQILDSFLKEKVELKKEVRQELSSNIIADRKEISAKLEAITKSEAKPDRRLKITHIISGGAPTQRFELKTEVYGDGEINHTFKEDSIEQQYSAKIDERSIRNLVKDIQSSGLLKLDEVGGGFIPDSIVGLITIEVDGKTTSYVYLADAEQRREQKKIVKQAVALMDNNLKRVAEIAKKRDQTTQKKIRDKTEKQQTP